MQRARKEAQWAEVQAVSAACAGAARMEAATVAGRRVVEWKVAAV